MWWRRLRYLLLLAALCSIATCPSAKRACTANTRAQEAEELLSYLADRVAAIHAATGKLPSLPAGPSPVPRCCEQGGACSPDPTVWATPAWRDLGFSIDESYRYTYQYVPDPTGTSATLRAVGDLDCDDQPSLYEVKLTVVMGRLSRVWTRKDPYE
ncbi:MAG: hypothetical protein JWP01_4051 [Myxococcales bacterium]|nr:hypothetical protein [Myxococcales bacterium]